MDEEINVAIAERADAVPLDMLDDIVAEYHRNVMFDGVRMVAAEA